jgi:hypothetical protein
MTIKYQIELSLDTLDADPFFTTQSPHPFAVSVGDEVDGDVVADLKRNEDVDVGSDERLVVQAIRHFLFSSDGSLPARNLRVAISRCPRK